MSAIPAMPKIGLVHSVPVEAVRHGATMDGAVTLAKLAALGAELQPTATVELFEQGWVATLVYAKPGFSSRIHHAHVPIEWAPRESLVLVAAQKESDHAS